jgi:hypothetical protein
VEGDRALVLPELDQDVGLDAEGGGEVADGAQGPVAGVGGLMDAPLPGAQAGDVGEILGRVLT